jgi:hypothetical protein
MKIGVLPPFAFIVAATIAIAAHFFVFAFRYMWYVKAGTVEFLLFGYGICLLLIILLWIFKPSTILVGTVGLLALVFPPLLRSDDFVRWDAPFIGFVLVSILLLIGATLVRSRSGG